jgi:hypothetical protein
LIFESLQIGSLLNDAHGTDLPINIKYSYLNCGHAPECIGALNVQRIIILEATTGIESNAPLLVNYGGTFHKNILEKYSAVDATVVRVGPAHLPSS